MSYTPRTNRSRGPSVTPPYFDTVIDIYLQLTYKTIPCTLIFVSTISLLFLSLGSYSPYTLLFNSLQQVSSDPSLHSVHRIVASSLKLFLTPIIQYQYILFLFLLVVGFLIINFSTLLLVIYLFLYLIFLVLSFSPTVAFIYLHLLFLFPKLYHSRHKYITLFLLLLFITFDCIQQLALNHILNQP